MKTNCCHQSKYNTYDTKVVCTSGDCSNYLNVTTLYFDYSKARKLAAVSIFIFSTLFSFDDYSSTNNNSSIGLHVFENDKFVPLTIENIKVELEKNEVICQREVIAQIKIESGNLSSFLVQRTNNLLGMRYPRKRNTVAVGIYLPESDTIILGDRDSLKLYIKQNNYAVYNCWQDAIADYAIWQKTNFKVSERYVDFLGRVYAQDSLYTDKIKAIASNIK